MFYGKLHVAKKNESCCLKINTEVISIKNHPMPLIRLEVVVLAIVNNVLRALLAKRVEEPYSGQWALPGGILKVDLDQTLDEGAQRVMQEKIGVTLPCLEQFCAVGGAKRDPRVPWALSVVYLALMPAKPVHLSAGKRSEILEWRPAENVIGDLLAFDHANLISRAVMKQREQVESMVMPWGLLEDNFTLSELQLTCEHVIGRPIDKSSFRRKLSDRELVEPVQGAMRGGAFRPAQLFRLK